MSATIARQVRTLHRPATPTVSREKLSRGDIALCLTHGLSVTCAADRGWVVRSHTRDDTGRVLGCIDESDDGVELMEIVGGFRWSTYPSVREALEHLIRDIT